MVNPIQILNAPPQRMLYQGQTPTGDSYGAQAYPQDSYAQPQQYSPEQIAYLQQLQQQQLQNQNIFSRIGHGVIDFFNNLPIWGKAILLVVAAFAGIKAGKFAGNNAYRIGNIFRPRNLMDTLGDRKLTGLVFAREDAERIANRTEKNYDKTLRSTQELKAQRIQQRNELRSKYGIHRRLLAFFGIGGKEIQQDIQRFNQTKVSHQNAKVAHQDAQLNHRDARMQQYARISEECNERITVLERTVEMNEQRLLNSNLSAEKREGLERATEAAKLEIESQKGKIHQTEANANSRSLDPGWYPEPTEKFQELTLSTDPAHQIHKPNWLDRLLASLNGHQMAGNPYAMPARRIKQTA